MTTVDHFLRDFGVDPKVTCVFLATTIVDGVFAVFFFFLKISDDELKFHQFQVDIKSACDRIVKY